LRKNKEEGKKKEDVMSLFSCLLLTSSVTGVITKGERKGKRGGEGWSKGMF